MDEKTLFDGCEMAFNSAKEYGYITELCGEDDIENNAYEILQFGFDDVDELTDDEFDKCVDILKSFLK